MPVVQVPNTVQPRQIEFYGEVERSKPGALYFAPGTVKSITDDEYDFIVSHHRKFANVLTILPISDKKSRLETKEENKIDYSRTKRPKDVLSKSKQRAKHLLENVNSEIKPSANTPRPNISANIPDDNKTSDDEKKKPKKENKS